MKVSGFGLSVAAAAWLSGTGLALAEDFSGSVGSGYGYSSGKYGTTTTTTIKSVPISASIAAGNFTFDASVPYLSVNGDPNVIPGVGKVSNTNPKKRGNGAATGSASGLGDVVLSASYDFYANDAQEFGFDLEGSVKLGTGDKAKGLGTGATDYTVGFGAYKQLDALTLIASLGYTAVGSSNYIKLSKNVVSFSAGAAYKVDADWTVGANIAASAGGAQHAKSGGSVGGFSGAKTREITAYFSYKILESLNLGVYALKGLSNASPDYGAGTTVTLSF